MVCKVELDHGHGTNVRTTQRAGESVGARQQKRLTASARETDCQRPTRRGQQAWRAHHRRAAVPKCLLSGGWRQTDRQTDSTYERAVGAECSLAVPSSDEGVGT